ncbi:hypothetical protein BH11ACT4_BH11ACT4_23880 [soil metagenome]
MTDSAFRESSNDPSAHDTPDGDPLRVGRGLVEDEAESGDTTGRTVTDDGGLEREFVDREQRDGKREIDREGLGSSGRTSLAEGGLGIHVMDSHDAAPHDSDADDSDTED